MGSIKPTTVPTKRLASSITASSTSFQLNNIKGWDGSDLASTDFGSVAYGIFRDPTNTIVELFSFDPSTIASSSISFVHRGLKFDGDPTTEISDNKLTWVRNQTQVELGSDLPQLLAHYVDDLSDQTIDGVKTFSDSPVVPTPTTDMQAATKKYVDDVTAAGAPDASTTTKGIVEIATSTEIDDGTGTGSTGAVLAMSPDQFQASDTYGNIPSADEKAALVGTSGTAPSATNKLVDADDVANDGTASKIVRATSSGDLPSSLLPSNLLYSLLAGEDIAEGDAVAAGYYQADGGLKIDAITKGTATSDSSGNFIVTNFTVGTNTNRVLLLFVQPSSSRTQDSVSSMEWNGDAFTTIDTASTYLNGNQYGTKSAVLVAPDEGNHNLTWSGKASTTHDYWIISLYNAVQSTTVDAHAVSAQDTDSSTFPFTMSITPATKGARLFTVTNISQNTGGGLSWENHGTSGFYYGETNNLWPLPGAMSINSGSTNTSGYGMSVAIAPITDVTEGYVVKATASNASATAADNFTNYRSKAFLGFAAAAASATDAVSVIISGVASGLSGMTSGEQQYLSDTLGEVSDSAGTLTRKVGIALADSDILITNEW